MGCKCVDDNGNVSDRCNGLCIKGDFIQAIQQERAMDDSFSPHQLQQIRRIIGEAFTHIDLNNFWIDGFLKGFEEGKSYGN